MKVPFARFCIDERPGELVQAEVLSSWHQRLKGLFGSQPSVKSVVLTKCASIHTIGMAYPIDVAFVGELGEVLEVYRHLEPGEVVGCPGASCVFERAACVSPWLSVGEHLWICSISADGCR